MLVLGDLVGIYAMLLHEMLLDRCARKKKHTAKCIVHRKESMMELVKQSKHMYSLIFE